MKKTQKARITNIKQLLNDNDDAVLNAIVTIYNNQTNEERNYEITRIKNGIGFNSLDADFLSSLAKQIISKGTLSKKQLDYGRKKIIKYARQLSEIENLVNGKWVNENWENTFIRS